MFVSHVNKLGLQGSEKSKAKRIHETKRAGPISDPCWHFSGIGGNDESWERVDRSRSLFLKIHEEFKTSSS